MGSILDMEKEKQVSLGLDFILSHFQQDKDLFPRTISTKTTKGKQILVSSKQEALARFKQAEYMDCRINAFPSYIEHRGEIIQESDFIFLDFDPEQFNSIAELEGAVRKSIHKIDIQFRNDPVVHATILYSGTGFHVYLPIKGIVLENDAELGRFSQVSQKFLKFASTWFSSGKSDSNNNPSLKSCLLRVPETINTKFGNTVKVIQRWNKARPTFQAIRYDFMGYLVDEHEKEQKRLRTLTLNRRSDTPDEKPKRITWIESLLRTPIDDFRKNTIALILAPYLLHNLKLRPDEAYQIIWKWLTECNKLRRLDFNPNYNINQAINNAIVKNIPPMRLITLEKKDKGLCNLILKVVHSEMKQVN